MEWLYNELWGVLKPHISKCIDKIKIRRKLKKITRKLSNQILSEFQNESYYNEFDKYLSVNKIISKYLIYFKPLELKYKVLLLFLYHYFHNLNYQLLYFPQ